MEYYVYTAVVEGVQRHCLAILEKEVASNKGLQKRAIAGFLKNGKVDVGEFEENQAFKDFLHKFIARHLPEQPDFVREGRKIMNGYVYLIDKRTKNPKGDVPMQDIIGAMNFENGNLLPDSYLPNKNYKLFTGKGFFGLPFTLEEALLKELQQP